MTAMTTKASESNFWVSEQNLRYYLPKVDDLVGSFIIFAIFKIKTYNLTNF